MKHTRILTSCALLSLCTSLLFSMSARAVTVPVEADAYVIPLPGAPGKRKFGSSPKMLVSGDPQRCQAYVRFNLDSLPAAITSSQVAKATLRLFVSDLSSSLSRTFPDTTVNFNITTPWIESEISGVAPPATGTNRAQFTVQAADEKRFIEIDINGCGSRLDGRGLAQQWIANHPWHSQGHDHFRHEGEHRDRARAAVGVGAQCRPARPARDAGGARSGRSSGSARPAGTARSARRPRPAGPSRATGNGRNER